MWYWLSCPAGRILRAIEPQGHQPYQCTHPVYIHNWLSGHGPVGGSGLLVEGLQREILSLGPLFCHSASWSATMRWVAFLHHVVFCDAFLLCWSQMARVETCATLCGRFFPHHHGKTHHKRLLMGGRIYFRSHFQRLECIIVGSIMVGSRDMSPELLRSGRIRK